MLSSSKFSISAVNRITGKSRTTIIKHIKQGKLSVELDADGNKVIDAAELIRVYGDDYDFGQTEKPHHEAAAANDAGTHHEVKRLQEQLDREIAERSRERQQYREQVEHLQETLKLAQEGHNRATLLLEKQPQGGGEWEQGLKRLEDRDVKENAARKINQYKKALEEERGKGWWDRLWG